MHMTNVYVVVNLQNSLLTKVIERTQVYRKILLQSQDFGSDIEIIRSLLKIYFS